MKMTNVLAGGGLKTMKRRLLGFQIVHVCFPEVGDSVVGVLYLEILRAKLPHEQRVSCLAD